MSRACGIHGRRNKNIHRILVQNVGKDQLWAVDIDEMINITINYTGMGFEIIDLAQFEVI